MIESTGQLYGILLGFIVIFLVYYFLYRKYIFSVFDPLFFFLISQAFTTELAIIQVENRSYLINILLCQIFLSVGFILIARKSNSFDIVMDETLGVKKSDYAILKYFTFISFFLILFANIYFIQKQGIILFSKDPSVSKIASYEGGLGFVRRINWGLLNLICITTMFLYFKTAKRVYLGILISLFLISISGGSKGAILTFVYILALLGLFKSFKGNSTFKSINKYKYPIIFFGVFLALFILYAQSSDYQSSFYALATRFLYSGDAILYYYNNAAIQHFSYLNWVDFFSYEFNSITGFFRLTEYKNPLGYDLVIFSIFRNESLETTQGPNLTYFLKGYLFFGNVGAIIFSFFIGIITGYLRKMLFNANGINVKFFLLVLFINLNLFSYPQDSGLFINIMFDTIIFGSLPLFLSYLFVAYRK